MEPGTRSSAGEHALHTGGVVGSIPTASTIPDDADWQALTRTRPRLKTDSSYTYVVVASGQGVKIGHSRRPKGRLSEMQVGSPLNMWITHTWRLSPADARQLERQLHAAFRWAALQGEWFEHLPHEIVAVGDLFVKGDVDGARALMVLIRRGIELERRRLALRTAWYLAPRNERRAAERAAEAEKPVVARDMALNELEEMRLGLWRHAPLHTRSGKRHLAWLEAQAVDVLSTE